MNRRTFTFVALGLLVWALVASLLGAYYYSAYSDLRQKAGTPIHVNLGINYGNGTIQWFNQTEARVGDSLLAVTLQVAKVYYETSAYGAFVKAINGVNQPTTKSWIWWTWNTQKLDWESGTKGSDAYTPGDNETLYWYFEEVLPPNYVPSPPPK